MNEVVYRLSLDIHETSSQAVIPIKRDDNNRLLIFTLREDGRNYIITPDCTARLRARRSDGVVLFNDCAINDNAICYTLTSQTASAPGLVECEITLYGADSRQITSPRFELVVDDVVATDEEIESHDEFTALQTALASVRRLPTPTRADAGKVLKVNSNGEWYLAEVIE